jgi:hypothetical protein
MMNSIHQRQNPLDSRQVNAFASLVRTGSFSETARELSPTHSAISHSLRALESELGCRLLNRLGKRVELTAAGEAFLFHAQNGLKNLEQARQTIEEFKHWGSQQLRIGASAALCQRLLPVVWAQLQRQHPKLLVKARTARQGAAKAPVILLQQRAQDRAAQCPPAGTAKQLDGALAAKVRAAQRQRSGNGEVCDRICAELNRCHSILINFAGPFTPEAFNAASHAIKFVWRELIGQKLSEYSEGISEVREGIKCVYSPSVADLCSHLFDCVVIDEGVKMKGADTQVGRGLRQMCPKYRLVLTATPVKNRLPDIFWLAWWAAGGHEEATARWPYAGGSDEQERFAAKFMLEEFNKTKAEDQGDAKSRYKKLRPEICNIHLLWKILAPTVLRRRKSDIGQSIVQKVRHVYRVPMCLHQRAVYRYHLESAYLDCNMRPAPGAKLQALRVAAAAPDSHLLDPQPGRVCRKCCPQPDFPVRGMSDCFTPICRNCGSPPLTHRSQHSFTPKVACALTLIRDVLARGEQAAVFSAFNDPSDILSRYLTEAGIDHYLLDGRTNQAKRGRQSAAFNNGECPITLASIDSMAEGHNWDKVNNVILTSYTWAADKIIQAINRVHRLTSWRDINIYVIICDQSADRVLEDNIAEKTNSSELAIDGRLLGEATEERSVSELLREAMRDFRSTQDCPNEETLAATWPTLREQLQAAARGWPGSEPRPGFPLESNRSSIEIDLATVIFPMPLAKPSPFDPVHLPSWRRFRFAA